MWVCSLKRHKKTFMQFDLIASISTLVSQVSGAAKKSGPSPRCMELSEPKGIPEGYLLARNDVCHVSRSAVKAKCTERLEKLAQPNVRATMDNVQFDPNAFLVKENALKALCSARTEELARPTYR